AAAQLERRAATAGYFPTIDVAANWGEIGAVPGDVLPTYALTGTLNIPIFQDKAPYQAFPIFDHAPPCNRSGKNRRAAGRFQDREWEKPGKELCPPVQIPARERVQSHAPAKFSAWRNRLLPRSIAAGASGIRPGPAECRLPERRQPAVGQPPCHRVPSPSPLVLARFPREQPPQSPTGKHCRSRARPDR